MNGRNYQIGIVGSGNLAWHLSYQFCLHYDGVKVFCRDTKETESWLHASRLHVKSVEDMNEADCEVLFLAVSDGAIGGLARQLAETNKVLVHCSGSTPLSVLEHSVEKAGVFYPLQTFTKGVAVDWQPIQLYLEASSKEVLVMLESLAKSMGSKAVPMNSTQRLQLHLAAVVACNFANHMWAKAESLCKELEVPFDGIQSLIAGTFQKSMKVGPFEGQTGPAKRGDKDILTKHLHLLQSDPDWAEIYQLISNDITRKHGR